MGLKINAGNYSSLQNANQTHLSSSLGSGAALGSSSASVSESRLRARLMTAREAELHLYKDPATTYISEAVTGPPAEILRMEQMGGGATIVCSPRLVNNPPFSPRRWKKELVQEKSVLARYVVPACTQKHPLSKMSGGKRACDWP